MFSLFPQDPLFDYVTWHNRRRNSPRSRSSLITFGAVPTLCAHGAIYHVCLHGPINTSYQEQQHGNQQRGVSNVDTGTAPLGGHVSSGQMYGTTHSDDDDGRMHRRILCI